MQKHIDDLAEVAVFGIHDIATSCLGTASVMLIRAHLGVQTLRHKFEAFEGSKFYGASFVKFVGAISKCVEFPNLVWYPVE